MPLIPEWPCLAGHKHKSRAGLFAEPLYHVLFQTIDIAG